MRASRPISDRIHDYSEAMSIQEAEQSCAQMDGCMGFAFKGSNYPECLFKSKPSVIVIIIAGNLNQTGSSVMITMLNATSTIKGGGAGCWTYRKYYSLKTDPYRTSFHFQPVSAWMNDPNGCMKYKGLAPTLTLPETPA